MEGGTVTQPRYNPFNPSPDQLPHPKTLHWLWMANRHLWVPSTDMTRLPEYYGHMPEHGFDHPEFLDAAWNHLTLSCWIKSTVGIEIHLSQEALYAFKAVGVGGFNFVVDEPVRWDFKDNTFIRSPDGEYEDVTLRHRLPEANFTTSLTVRFKRKNATP